MYICNIKIYIHLSNMYESKYQMQLPAIKCSSQQEGYSICCSKNCEEYPFICLDRNCQCIKKLHRDCISVRWQSIISRVWSKKKESFENFDEFTQEIEKVYDEVIDKLSRQKEKFLDWKVYIGLNEPQRQMMRKVQDGDEIALTGKLMHKVTTLISEEQSIDITDPKMVKQYWQGHQDRLQLLVAQLKNMYLRPCQPFPKDLVKFQDSINKLFDKNPTKLINIHQGSQSNFSMTQFHRQCDGIKNTLVVMQTTDGKISGGFTPIAWESTEKGAWKSDSSRQTFTFQTEDLDQLSKSKSSSSNSVYHNSLWGPSFGSGTDIIIFNHEKSSESAQFSKASSYENRGYDLYIPQGSKQNGKQIKDFWVFQVLFD